MDSNEWERRLISSLDFLEELQKKVLMGEVLTTMNQVLAMANPDDYEIMHKGFQRLLKELEKRI